MKRRKFLTAFVGAVATVAIGLKLAEPMPELKIIGIDWAQEPSHSVAWYAHYDARIVNSSAIVRINTA